uniref:Dipeptidase n=1 Tax=Zooxanthella nutricula TaxID=1333877 RepID=A0A7S2HNW7_9DINO
MNADSASADYRLTFVPPRMHKEATRPVFTYNLSYPRFVGYGRGAFYHPKHESDPLYVPVGHIPEVKSTFGYYEATEPLMNDQGLGLGESSCAAMLVNKFPGDDADARDVPTGMLDTVTLMQLALERCATARCAAETMGRLSEEFGFVPTPGEPTKGRVFGRTAWDDAGEAYTMADPSGEAWVFHVVGGVNGVTKSVWAAQKVPKGHFAVIANDFIIGELPEEPTDDFLFNRHAFRAARAAGLWDGVGKLHFSRAFAPDPMSFESPAGATPIPLYASVRRWGLYNLAAPSMRLAFKTDNQEYPVFVKVEKKLSHRDVMGYFRYQYEGTEFDMTKGVLAGPFGTPFRLEGGPKTGQVPRGIAIQRTLYSIIAHTGPERQLAWFAMDTPTTSVYVPLFSNSSAVAPAYSRGHQSKFDRESAAWAFNFVSNFMNLNYVTMSKEDVYPAIENWQDRIDEQLPSAEKMKGEALAKWQASVQEEVAKSWWNMSDFLIMKYNDGRVNSPTVGKSPGYPAWFADLVGFSNDIHPVWVQAAGQPVPSIGKSLNLVRPEFQLPVSFDFATSSWSYLPAKTSLSSAGAVGGIGMGVIAMQALFTAGALAAGVALGRASERRRGAAADAAAPYLRLA